VEELREFATPAQYALLGELSKLLYARPMDGLTTAQSSAGVTTNPFQLIQHMQSLLASYKNLDHRQQLNPTDAFFTYRLLLGRNPDLAEELPYILSDIRPFREFLSNLLSSEEFSRRMEFIPPNRVLMAELEDFRLWFNTSDREMGLVMVSGQYEPPSVGLVKNVIRPGMKCIDAGAHIGFYTCLMASLTGDTGMVYAFEPMPSNYELLMKNIEENQFHQRVKAYQIACSDNHGSLRASKVSNMFVMGQISGAEQIIVETVRLEDVVDEPIDVVKLDVEGHEPAVIHGMKSIILRDKPIIFSEINEYWLRSCSQSDATGYIGLLESLGYEVFDVKNPDQPINGSSLKFDILDIMDVVAFPLGRGR
jgi:FkbM family methyltransferase